MKTLVAYYSYSGYTEAVARSLAAEIHADAVAVEDVERPSKLKAYVLGAFAARKGETWPIKPVSANIAAYDRIFVGAPIWWGKTAPEMNTFIDGAGLSGKQVIVFVTMGGSDPQEALRALTERVTKRGGKVVSSFSVKTGGLKKEAAAAKTREIAAQYK